jgi:hypothetical protein
MSSAFVQLQPDQTGKKVQSVANGGVEAQVVTIVDGSGLTNSYVQITEGSGKKMQHFKNLIGGNEVHALAVVLVDQTGAAI